jgi:hypothetical protein
MVPDGFTRARSAPLPAPTGPLQGSISKDPGHCRLKPVTRRSRTIEQKPHDPSLARVPLNAKKCETESTAEARFTGLPYVKFTFLTTSHYAERFWLGGAARDGLGVSGC